MLETRYREYYQRWLINPMLKLLSNWLSATRVTVMAGLVGFLVMPLLWFHLCGYATLCLLLSGYLDTLDGSLARVQQMATPHGAVLDIVTDRFVEIMVIIGLWGVAPDHRSLLCLLMLASILMCVTSFLVVGIFTQNEGAKSFYYSPGLIERAEAFIFFILLIWLPHQFVLIASIFSALVLLTAISRIYQFFKLQSISSAVEQI
ncbi:MAG: CDP-alcohol phosphatidyltransferase family protein [Gammaproteobacteria bacterium]